MIGVLAISRLRGREEPCAFGRSIPRAAVTRAVTVALLAGIIVIAFIWSVMAAEAGRFGFGRVVFEVISAFGTVGLSTGITKELGTVSRLLLIALMYIGRLGPLTVVVSVAAVIFTWVVALPIGIYSAVRQYSLGDYLFTFIGFVGVAIPSFLLALIVMYLGFKYFNANVGGLFSAEYQLEPWGIDKVLDLLKHLPLPAIVLGLAGTAQLIRIMRANLLDEIRKPYVVTARAKGLSEMRVIMKYPVRAALNPFASTIGYLFPFIVSGSIIVSLVLSLPTVGPLLLKALLAQDMFLAGTIMLLLGVMTVIGTFISDVLLMWIEPRIRIEGK